MNRILKLLCSLILLFNIIICQGIEIILTREPPQKYYFNYKFLNIPTIINPSHTDDASNLLVKKEYEITFEDVEYLLPIVCTEDSTYFADINNNGRFEKSEKIVFPEYNIYGQQHINLGLNSKLPNIQSIYLRKDYYGDLHFGLSELYVGQLVILQDTLRICLFLEPGIFKYQISENLYIAIDKDNDMYFNSNEIFPTKQPFSISNHLYTITDLSHKADNLLLTIKNVKSLTSPIEGFYHPDITLKSISDMKNVRLSDFHNKLVVMNFWFINCSPCIKKIPSLNKLPLKYPSIEFLAINPIDDINTIRSFVKNRSYIFKHFVIDNTSAYNINVRSMPHTVILNKNRKIVYKGNATTKNIIKIIESQL